MDQAKTSSDGEGEYAGPPKVLLRVVYIMGIILVLLFLLLIVGIVWKANRAKPVPTAEDLALSLGLKAADIRNVDMDGGSLAITTTREIIVIDVSKRKVLLREPLAE